jgi:hypothetical protein
VKGVGAGVFVLMVYYYVLCLCYGLASSTFKLALLLRDEGTGVAVYGRCWLGVVVLLCSVCGRVGQTYPAWSVY